MVTTAAKVEWTVVTTEVEALQLEYNWIKEFDPRFNVRYRDDKSYPVLAVTLNEEYPRLFVYRGPRRKGVRYFGPYSHAWAIRETLDLLTRVFPARTCSAGVFKRHKPDRASVPARLHRQVLGAVRRPGQRRGAPRDRRGLLRLPVRARPTGWSATWNSQMNAAADELDFERAARLRDDIGALQARAGEAGGGARRRHRRRRGGVRRRRPRGGRAGVPRPRRPGARPARLDRREVR